MSSYNPSPENKKILDTAMAHIRSVPYQASLRWVFYRLLQEGFYPGKKDYVKWKSLASVARKRFYNGWRPDTMMDDTRDIIRQNYGYLDEAHATGQYFEDLCNGISVDLDHFTEQEEIVMVCFEARAMTDQFRHYIDRVALVPFGGDPSIHLKWKVAKDIERLARRYDKPVRVLYFGDLDPKGSQIVGTAIKDIRDWCSIDFKLTHCGLTEDQVEMYDIAENPFKPGEYQWEALVDSGAAEIIEDNVYHYVDRSVIDSVEAASEPLTKRFKAIAKAKLL